MSHSSPSPSPSPSSMPRAATLSARLVDASLLYTGQRVRFNAECVLIPDPSPVSRMPRLVTKSYAVPLWKRRGQASSSLSDSELDVSGKEDDHVVLKVSVPSFAIKSRSPSRSDAAQQPLVPCIVHHAHASSPSQPPHARRPSTSSSPRSDVITVPLRQCCPDCFSVTEDCLEQGDEWQERFTRAARRRRDSSADSRDNIHPQRRLIDAMPGFDSVIAVDEVEKVCKARDEAAPPSASWPSACDQDIDISQFQSWEPLGGHTGYLSSPHSDLESPSSPSPSTPSLVTTIPPVLAPHRACAEAIHENGLDAVPLLDLDFGFNPELLDDDALALVNLTYPLRRSRSSGARLASKAASMSSAENMPLPQSLAPARSPYSSVEVRSSPVAGPKRSLSVNRRRPQVHLPGPSSILKVSTDFLKGVSFSAGTPLSV